MSCVKCKQNVLTQKVGLQQESDRVRTSALGTASAAGLFFCKAGERERERERERDDASIRVKGSLSPSCFKASHYLSCFKASHFLLPEYELCQMQTKCFDTKSRFATGIRPRSDKCARNRQCCWPFLLQSGRERERERERER